MAIQNLSIDDLLAPLLWSSLANVIWVEILSRSQPRQATSSGGAGC